MSTIKLTRLKFGNFVDRPSICAMLNIISIVCLLTQQILPTQQSSFVEVNSKTTWQRHKRNQGTEAKDFAPKLIHQPHSVTVEPGKPHTIECPIEAQPESDIRWFKDDQLLESEPTHLEQTGAELMFFQLNHNDEGHYHCQASNYLGQVASERFRLLVRSAVRDANVRLEPQVAELAWQPISPGGQTEITCTINSLAQSSQILVRPAEVVIWRRNGRRLRDVIWLSDEQDLASSFYMQLGGASNRKQQQPATKFVARQTGSGIFQLKITQAAYELDHQNYHHRNISDNTTMLFTCAELQTNDNNDNDPIEHESNEIQVKLVALAPVETYTNNINNNLPAIKIDTEMAPPIEGLANSNQTTRLEGNNNVAGGNVSSERNFVTALNDLYKVSKPSLMLISLLCLIGLVASLVQLSSYLRKRSRENRYMKHQYCTSGASNNSGSGSGTSSAFGGSLDYDPVLSSLLSRTLSAPSSTSLAGNAGKKYKSYRDHMRKVAAVANNLATATDCQLMANSTSGAVSHALQGSDFMDIGYTNSLSRHHHQQLSGPYFGAPVSHSISLALPNLYNQSLAARQQAQVLLQQVHQMGSGAKNDHYSTIETNEDEEARYEELDGAGSANLIPTLRQQNSMGQPQHHLRSLTNSSTTSGCGDSSTTISSQFGSKRQRASGTQHLIRQSKIQDQLSPYAVSSICNNTTTNQPPPNSEAMKALNEQFDLSHLMMDDPNCNRNASLPFQTPPPPPSSASDCLKSSFGSVKHKAKR